MNIVDTSVVTKWFLREKYSEEAISLLEQEQEFIAPDYLRIEFHSNISNKVRAGFITNDESREILGIFEIIDLWFEPYKNLESLAFELSTNYPVTFYDAIFIALAFNTRSILYTFDEKLKKSAANTAFDELISVPV